jgi:hypothetical protein
VQLWSVDRQESDTADVFINPSSKHASKKLTWQALVDNVVTADIDTSNSEFRCSMGCSCSKSSSLRLLVVWLRLTPVFWHTSHQLGFHAFAHASTDIPWQVHHNRTFMATHKPARDSQGQDGHLHLQGLDQAVAVVVNLREHLCARSTSNT